MIKTALICSSALALLAPSAAWAQDTAPVDATAGTGALPTPTDQPAGGSASNDPAAVAAGTGLADIVVTAQKRDSTLQRTPASVQVIGSAQLVDRGVTDLVRLQSQVSGVIIQPSRSSVYIFSRGLGQADAQYQTSPAIEVQEDGLTLPRSGQQFALFDVGNIQVLKGPQGILYGRYGIGGAVLVNSKRPTYDRIKLDGFFEYGNYDMKHVFAGVNLPVADNAGFRASVDYNNHNNYVRNGGYALDQIAGRLSFQTNLGDRFKAFIAFTASNRKGDGFPQINFPRPPEAGGDPFFILPVPTSGTVGAANFNIRQNRGFNESTSYLINGQLDYKLTDDLNLSYVAGYFDHSSAQVNAWQNRPGGTFVNYATTYYVEKSQDVQNELRATFARDGWTAIIGGLQHRFTAQDNVVQAAYLAGALINGPQSPREYNYAVFGDLTVPLANRFRVELGARQSWDNKYTRGRLSGVLVDINSSNFKGFKNFSWKVGAEYDLAPQILTYANVQTGYLPGAYQTATQATLNNLGLDRRYASQKVTAYQVGVKSRFFDNRVQLNVEGFYYDYKNFQVTQRVPDPVIPGGFQSPYANIKKSRIYGADIDLNVRVIRDGTFTMGLSLLNTKILNSGFTALAVLQPNGSFQLVADPSLRGYDLPFSPNVTLNLGYEQIFRLGNDAQVVANVGTHHESSKYLDYTRSQVFPGRHPGFWKTDVSLTYRAPGNRWNVAVWGRNLEDTATYSAFTPAQLRANNTGPVLGAYSNVYIDSPRTYGVRVGVNF